MTRTLLLSFVISLLSCTNNTKLEQLPLSNIKLPIVELSTKDNFKIGVIGAGIAGASFVHFINQAVAKNCSITVFEKENRLGGRVKNDKLGGGLIEQGATLIHSSNHYLQDIIETYDLQKTKPHGGEGEAETLAIWDGEEFKLNTSRNSLMSTMQMLLAYGLSLSDLSDLVKATIPKWQQVYHQLGEGTSYSSPEALFKAINLYDLTQQTSYDFFKEKGIKDDLVYEFIDCISRVNYHQDGNINAFTDIVSLAGAGIDGGSLFSVDGGNDLMIKSILQNQSNVRLQLNQPITTINTLAENGNIQYELITEKGDRDTFDIVVAACPLDLAQISLPGHSLKMDRQYQTVHANFIAGEIDYSYFNNVSNKPQTIFTIENDDIPFVSIAKTSYAPEWDVPIYKVFSRNPLNDSFFDQTFKNRKGQTHQEWKAYTVLSPMTEWPPFKINEGLFYINAMESAVSAMETETVAARNVANLTLEYMKGGVGIKD